MTEPAPAVHWKRVDVGKATGNDCLAQAANFSPFSSHLNGIVRGRNLLWTPAFASCLWGLNRISTPNPKRQPNLMSSTFCTSVHIHHNPTLNLNDLLSLFDQILYLERRIPFPKQF
jgi:hypothetical protein